MKKIDIKLKPKIIRNPIKIDDYFDVFIESYDKEFNYLNALTVDNERITVDPFVSTARNYKQAKRLIGKNYRVEGFWFDTRNFIAMKMYLFNL